MKKVELVLANAEKTRDFGVEIGQAISRRALILLIGPLGAGKTLLVQGISEALGVVEPVVSPTFTMLNEYHSGRLPLYHLDLYRVSDDPATLSALGGQTMELLRAELDEFIHGEAVVLIEWAEHILPFLPPDYLLVKIDYLEESEGRQICLEGRGEESCRLVQEVNSRVIYP